MHPTQTPANLVIRCFNELQDYTACFNAMRDYTAARDASSADECWLLQHHDVLTQGQAGKPEHIIAPTQLNIVQSDRGGQVTWHGPGQLVMYFLFDLNRLGWHVRDLVTFAETAMIRVLQEFAISAHAKPDAPGVYVNEQKIGSLGFKIRRGCSYHGLSLNIDCALDGFAVINPCGYHGLQMVRISDLCDSVPTHSQITQAFVNFLNHAQVFDAITLKNDDAPFSFVQK